MRGELGKTEREQAAVRQMEAGLTRLSSELASIGEKSAPDAETLEELADNLIPNELLPHLQNYISLNQEEADRSNERNQSTANQLMLGLLLLGTCGGVAGLLAGYIIARRVSRTIVQLSFPLRDVAGKLDEIVGPVTVAADPGFQDLETVLQIVSQRVSTVVERLHANEREVLRAEQLAAMGQLAAGMAHELRNPLTSIKTIIQLGEQPKGFTPRDLEVLQEEIERLECSVQAFLDFARPPRVERCEAELKAVVAPTVDLMAYRAERQRIDFQFAASDAEIPVWADPGQIRQVVLNLVLNAFDAVGAGGNVRLEVSLSEYCSATSGSVGGRDNAADPWCPTIRVTDNGPGLPREHGQRIFEPFVSTKESGTGLGLSICRRIIEAHEGNIGAECLHSGGSAFVVQIPARESPEAGCLRTDGGKSTSGVVSGRPSFAVTGAEHAPQAPHAPLRNG